ncbi:HAD family phosphatase [bacterium]|nr:HAD family phosphatase [candidate division CSSED10-310 bacterium]
MIDPDRIQGILLDFDGTLVHSEPYYFRAFSEVFMRFGHRIDEREYYIHWSLKGEGCRGEIDRYALKNIDADQARRKGLEIFERISRTERIPLLPGARELLEILPERGYRLTIASNSSRQVIRNILDLNGLSDLAIPIPDIDAGMKGKPYPDIFLKALEQLGLPADRCVVIEDTLKGLASGHAAGIAVVIVRSALYPDTVFEDADLVVDSLFDVLNLLPERN